MNDDFSKGTDDEVAQAMQAALAQTVARAAPASGDWTKVVTDARQARMVRRVVVGSACVVVLLAVVGFAAASAGGRRGVSVVGTETTTTSGATRSGADVLAFRPVLGSIPFGTANATAGETTASAAPQQVTDCRGGRLATAPANQAVDRQVIIADRSKSACYLLGPTILTGEHVASVEVVQSDVTNDWELDLHFDNDDFVKKVASVYVGKQIAIVVDGVVESAPTINQGITGRDVTISGAFDKATATSVGERIMPSGVKVVPTAPPSAEQLQMDVLAKRCDAVAPTLNLGSSAGTTMVTVDVARAGFRRARQPVPANLVGLAGTERLAVCEGMPVDGNGVPPTSVCPNGDTVDVGSLVMYAVDAKLQVTRLPELRYLFPGASSPPPTPC